MAKVKEVYKVLINGVYTEVTIVRKEQKKERNIDGTLNAIAWGEIIDEIMKEKLNVGIWEFMRLEQLGPKTAIKIYV